jgi:hypothetical protein
MSKKYVPSFLKDSLPSGPASVLSSTTDSNVLPVRERVNDFPDAFQMKKPKKDSNDSNDLFPMSRKKTADFDAFTKVKPLPEMDAFVMNRRTDSNGSNSSNSSNGLNDFDAFGKKPKKDDFPMNKGERGERRENSFDGPNEYDPFRSKKHKENRHTSVPPVIPSVSFAPGTLASLTARKATDDSSKVTATSDDVGNSFAAKFAQRMKIIEDPDFVPPPAIVNVSSEEEFPTLGFVASTKKVTTWNLPSLSSTSLEEVVSVVIEEKESAPTEDVVVRKKKTQSQSQDKKKKIPVLRRKQVAVASTVLEGEVFKPIEYDEDAFEEDEWNQSDLDEEEFFHDSGDDDDEEDELNPNVYDDRRHRDELY